MPEVNDDDVVSSTLPHVDDVVVIRFTKNIDLLRSQYIFIIPKQTV